MAVAVVVVVVQSRRSHGGGSNSYSLKNWQQQSSSSWVFPGIWKGRAADSHECWNSNPYEAPAAGRWRCCWPPNGTDVYQLMPY